MPSQKLKILLVALLISAFSNVSSAQQVDHPLNALDATEVTNVVSILQRAGKVDKDTLFTAIRLKEPDKAAMWAWREGDAILRQSFVVFRQGAKTFEAIVDISNSKVISVEQKTGVESSVLISEWRMAQALTLKDSNWQKAMRKRGFTDFDSLFCSPILPGYLPGRDYQGKRIFNVPCYEVSKSLNNRYGRPVEGVYAVVDVNAKAVIDVVDTGVVPVPPPVRRYESQGKTAFRPALKPVINVSPQGANFKLKGGLQVEWQNWSFHLRFERRNGVVISLVRYNDKGKLRKIAYQMALSEMFVPYMDPYPAWSYKAFLDAGEYGLGYLASSLRPGKDCPLNAVYINTIVPSDTGKVFDVERAMCIFERATGDPAWRHAENAGRDVESRRAVDLVVRMITTVGNYDYALDWVFTQSGDIKLRLGATGILAIKGVETKSMKDATAPRDTKYGTLVAENSTAPNHDHYFSYRIDLDVDGSKNTFVEGKIAPVTLPPENPRRQIWTVDRTPAQKETTMGEQSGLWFVKNTNKQTDLGHNPSVKIEMPTRVTSPLSPKFSPQSRAVFSNQSLWITAYNRNEVYAAGNFPNQSKGGDGLPAWIASPQSIKNKDIVLWPTIGINHIPRAEDWPMMPTLWREITIQPFNFFDENPALDLNPDFARPKEQTGKAE